jgi:hypothetical protein
MRMGKSVDCPGSIHTSYEVHSHLDTPRLYQSPV